MHKLVMVIAFTLVIGRDDSVSCTIMRWVGQDQAWLRYRLSQPNVVTGSTPPNDYIELKFLEL